MAEENLINEKQDSIKISKTSKGYTWEIKLYYDFNHKYYKDVFKELQDIDKELNKTFGSS